jgi:phosphoribosylformylglycinamidine synthase
MSVANASRKISCMGIKPMHIAIHNIFPKPNSKSNWFASELLQGQEEAIREIDLEIGNRQIDTFNENWYQNVLTVGYVKNNSSKVDISFKNNGDFISLLGSHRGELGGSEYEKYISDNTSKSFPSVDLNMEPSLQDVVQQGINTSLIKSATNVGMGGISIAIAKSLFASDVSIGARIHLSRKLTDQELLFGETQGLVVVTLSEEDIMEFERICMTVGVPSTTIGRVTDNNTYTFNESISLNVDKIRKVLN